MAYLWPESIEKHLSMPAMGLPIRDELCGRADRGSQKHTGAAKSTTLGSATVQRVAPRRLVSVRRRERAQRTHGATRLSSVSSAS
jgi:hypothetical protein